MTSWTFSYLWTDILIWALVLMVLGFIYFVINRPHLRLAWRKVFYKPIHLTASMLLAFFVCVGLLDSIHIKIQDPNHPNNGIISILDIAMSSARHNTESSYSSPMATHLFTKKTIEQADGSMIRDFPRLEHGGAHLKDVSLRGADIRARILIASSQAAIVWLSICCLIAFISAFLSKQTFEIFMGEVIKGDKKFPWRTFFLVIGIMLVTLFILFSLMPYYHVLGTSKIGEDVLYQTVKSIRTGLVIGTLTTLFMLPLAVILGIMAGFFRGWVDDVIQYLYTTLSSIPGVLLIAAAVLTLQVMISQHSDLFTSQAQRSDARLLALCLILGITSWTGLCRLLRAETLKLREIEFVQAAKALGVKQFKIIFKHLLPNVIHIILISIALDFSGLVLAEAVLSYVGVGVDPSSYSWGTMINGARLELARAPIVWWSLVSAFIFMFIMVLSANIFADAVRDAFDPRV